jgi:hypothetical protein
MSGNDDINKLHKTKITASTYGTGTYQMRCTVYKVALDDGLI